MDRSPAILVALVGMSACGGSDSPPPAPTCKAPPETIVRALAAAPRPVVLEDGSTLSSCLAGARTDAELQTVGIAFSGAAERLRGTAPQDPVSAGRLGYLVGATQKGASTTNGVLLELQRRIESAAGRALDEAAPPSKQAFDEGLRAGKASG